MSESEVGVVVRDTDVLRSPSPFSQSFTEMYRLAEIFVQSGLFKDVGDVAKATVKIMAGAELGIPPIASMRGVHVVEGKTELASNLMAALIKRSGKYNYRDTGSNEECAGIEFSENGKVVGVSTFSMHDAKRAGLADRQTWRRYPAAMLWARALSQGARRYCPDIFIGAVYVTGEISDEVVPQAPEDASQWVGTVEDDVPYVEDPNMVRRRFWARLRPAMAENGWSESDLKGFIREAFGKESTKDLTEDERQKTLDTVQTFERPEAPDCEQRWEAVLAALEGAGIGDAEAFIHWGYGGTEHDSITDLPESTLETYEAVAADSDMVAQMKAEVEKWRESQGE